MFHNSPPFVHPMMIELVNNFESQNYQNQIPVRVSGKLGYQRRK